MALAGVTLRGKDAWPFSHYPMFSTPMTLASVRVIRLALETKAGEVVWWESCFYRYPEFIGRRLRQLYRLENLPGQSGIFFHLERQKYLREVARLIEFEEGSLDRYRALRIVLRSVKGGSRGNLDVHEQILFRISFDELRGAGR